MASGKVTLRTPTTSELENGATLFVHDHSIVLDKLLDSSVRHSGIKVLSGATLTEPSYRRVHIAHNMSSYSFRVRRP